MECTRYRESIQDLIDGTIGPIRRAELERHLDGCPDCRALVADLETIRDAGRLARSDRAAVARLASDRRATCGRKAALPRRRRHVRRHGCIRHSSRSRLRSSSPWAHRW